MASDSISIRPNSNEDSRALDLCRVLVGFRLRTKAVQAFTRLGEKTIRSVYSEVNHGERPDRGKLSSGDNEYLHPSRHLQSSYSASLLHLMGLTSPNGPSLETLVAGFRLADAYQQYISSFTQPQHCANTFFALATKYLREGHFAFKSCGECETPYLVDPVTPARFSCPFCAKAASLVCKSCGTARSEHSDCCSNTSCKTNLRKRRHPDDTLLDPGLFTNLSIPQD